MLSNNRSWGRLLVELREYFRDLFNLSEDKESEEKTIEQISQSVVFRGANLWILIFAIMVCSVGLDVNSTPVVIGAMLISPLMGPIMGIGLGVGIHDGDLILKALKNLGIAVIISILTSSLYFWISPINEPQSELLSRTTPGLWDVIIAIFGGFAGIVAGSRKEKSNAIPGVAIATALMPPLCTTGYMLADGEWIKMINAFYLFCLNSVFISVTSYLIVKALRYRPKKFLDEVRERKVKRYISFLILVIIIPSIYTSYQILSANSFNRHAKDFITQELQPLMNTHVIDHELTYTKDFKKIEVTLIGEPLDDEAIAVLEKKLVDTYKIKACELEIIQDHQNGGVDMATVELLNQQMKVGIIEDLYRKNEALIKSKEDRIKLLENELVELKSKQIPAEELIREVRAINKSVKQFSIAPSVMSYADNTPADTFYLAYFQFENRQTRNHLNTLENWLKARIKSDKIKIIAE